jgi:hypothetical protein
LIFFRQFILVHVFFLSKLVLVWEFMVPVFFLKIKVQFLWWNFFAISFCMITSDLLYGVDLVVKEICSLPWFYGFKYLYQYLEKSIKFTWMQEVDVKNVPSSSSMKKFSLDDALMGSETLLPWKNNNNKHWVAFFMQYLYRDESSQL